MEKGRVLAIAYSRKPNGLLPSALDRLTAEFGMGSGVTSPLIPRELCPLLARKGRWVILNNLI